MEKNSPVGEPLLVIIETLSTARKRLGAPELSIEAQAELSRHAHRKDPVAMFWLGWYWNEMHHITEGMAWLEKAAAAGLPIAMGERAMHRYWSDLAARGPILPEPRIVSDWRMAAEAGDYSAQFLLGTNALDTIPLAESLEWLERSAAQQYPLACEELGERFYSGEDVPQQWTRAGSLFRQAVAMALNPQFAAVVLAIMHAEGQGVEKDALESLKYLKGFAQALWACGGSSMLAGLGETFYLVGCRYVSGYVGNQVATDRLIRANFWFGQSLQCGHRKAASALIASGHVALERVASAEYPEGLPDGLRKCIQEGLGGAPPQARDVAIVDEQVREDEEWIKDKLGRQRAGHGGR